jgi:AcrR family transcriptional regulator
VQDLNAEAEEPVSVFRAQTANARRESGRGLVVANATRLFDEKEYDEISVEDIASASGMSVRTFYRYFGSRDEVLVEFALRGADRIPAQLAARPADEPPLQALILAFAERDAAALEHTRVWNSVMARLPAKYAYVVASVGRRVQEMLLPELRKRLSPSELANGDDLLLSGLATAIVSAMAEHEGRSVGESSVLLATARARDAFLAITAAELQGPARPGR